MFEPPVEQLSSKGLMSLFIPPIDDIETPYCVPGISSALKNHAEAWRPIP